MHYLSKSEQEAREKEIRNSTFRPVETMENIFNNKSPQYKGIKSNLYWVGANRFDCTLFKPIQNIIHTKPSGGLWLSPIDKLSESRLPIYAQWCIDENFNTENLKSVAAVIIRFSARVLVLDDIEDGVDFLLNYIRQDDPMALIVSSIDFEKAAKDFDVIYATQRFLNQSRGTKHLRDSFYGWDIECCLVLNPESFFEDTTHLASAKCQAIEKGILSQI